IKKYIRYIARLPRYRGFEFVARPAVQPALPAGQPLAERDPRTFARAVEHRRRLGMMVEPLLRPIIHHHGEIEIIGADPRARAISDIVTDNALFDMAPCGDMFGGAIGYGDRRGSRRPAQAFLQ